jgi:hypothetical protein
VVGRQVRGLITEQILAVRGGAGGDQATRAMSVNSSETIFLFHTACIPFGNIILSYL